MEYGDRWRKRSRGGGKRDWGSAHVCTGCVYVCVGWSMGKAIGLKGEQSSPFIVLRRKKNKTTKPESNASVDFQVCLRGRSPQFVAAEKVVQHSHTLLQNKSQHS